MSSPNEVSTPMAKSNGVKTVSSDCKDSTMNGNHPFGEVMQKVIDNENTPEGTKKLEPQNLLPSSGNVQQSAILDEEMPVENNICEDTSSIDGSHEFGKESPSMCENDDGSDIEEFANGANKEFLHSTKIGELKDDEEQIESKENVLEEIFKTLIDREGQNADVDSGKDFTPIKETAKQKDETAEQKDDSAGESDQGEEEDNYDTAEEESEEEATEPIAAEPTTQEVADEAAIDLIPSASDKQTQAATEHLVVLLDEEQNKKNDTNKPANPITIETRVETTAEVETAAETSAERPMTFEEKQAFILDKFTPGLEPVLKNDHWLSKKPENLPFRDALSKVGHCATELIMQALVVNPSLYHLKKERDWFGKNMLTKKGVYAVLARIGVVEGHSRVFWPAYDHIQRFSGTYIFVRHSLDHGSFHVSLHTLTEKAQELRMFKPNINSTELKRTPRCDPSHADDHQAVATIASSNSSAMNLVKMTMGRPSMHQQASPLSPRVFNFDTKDMSPKKRASSSKENQESSPGKRQRSMGGAVFHLNLPSFIFPRM